MKKQESKSSVIVPAASRGLFLIFTSLMALFAVIVIELVDNFANSHASPVLSVSGTASDAYPGSETTYRIELLNHTDQIVYDGVITITLPAGFTYVPNSTIALGEGWPMESREPIIDGQSLAWGPYHLPAAGNKAHNPFGIHTMMHDCGNLALHLEGAKSLIGNGGYVTQLFYGLDATTTGPSQCAVNFVSEAYARNLIPILRLEGHFANGVWQAPDPGPDGDYSEVAQGFANFVAGLPRRDTNPLYIQVWNEPDLWIEWSGSPNAGRYARFFVAVSRAIRQLGDGRIRIINGALTPGNPGFIDQMLQVPGFRDGFDAWSSHCYPYNHPAWYNNHAGTARYGTYAIDCYLQELAVIRRYGRSDVKVILTETGYELGSNTFGFEGFPPINETNRAGYITSAFADYWQNWPEVIAVTPFELSDISGHWHKFDWLFPTSPYLPHPQYDAVAALAKPDGGLEPYGYQIIFRVSVDPEVAPGIYTSQLAGSERDNSHVLDPEAVPVRIHKPDALQFTYLPLILAPARRDGPWYFSAPESASPGAIVPSNFLKPAAPDLASLTAITTETAHIKLAGEPRGMAVTEETGLGAILLADGHVEIIDLSTMQSTGTIFAGANPHMISADAPGPAQVYVSLEDEVVLVDLQTRQVVNRWRSAGRWRGLGWDAATQRLFVADAEHERLLVLQDDLSQQLAEITLDAQPDQLLIDSEARQIFLSVPAIPEVMAIDADSLAVTGQASMAGGPILDLALDANQNRLYALSALAPGYRAITSWDSSNLRQLHLVAGVGDLPLHTASAIGITPTGQLLVSEATGLWQISPLDFTVRNVFPNHDLSLVAELTVDQPNNAVFMLEPLSNLLRVYQ